MITGSGGPGADRAGSGVLGDYQRPDEVFDVDTFDPEGVLIANSTEKLTMSALTGNMDLNQLSMWEKSLHDDTEDAGHAPVCGPMLFGIGTVASFVLGTAVSIMIPSPAVRVIANAIGSEAMVVYAHYAGDKVPLKAAAAVGITAAMASVGVLQLESCCHHRDQLLMALLPNAAAVIAYTFFRDLGVLMKIQYGKTLPTKVKAGARAGRRKRGRRKQEKRDEVRADQIPTSNGARTRTHTMRPPA
jgi:hypothetical protein